MKNIVNNNLILGGKILDDMTKVHNIIKDTLTCIIPNKYQKKLCDISENYTIYTWWSNIPVYDCKKSKHFLDFINFKNNNLNRFNWNIFDDMLYNYFCILFYNYKLYIIPNYNHSLEGAESKLIKFIDKSICKLYWLDNATYKQDTNYYDDNNFYIVYHLDR